MDQVLEFFVRLFDTAGWPARWVCGTAWTPFHGYLYIVSDLSIWLAYMAIPIILIRFIKMKPGVPLPKVFWLFGAFILLCGATHLIDALLFYWPAYRLSGLIRLLTAAVSWLTVIALIRYVPAAMKLRTSEQFDEELARRKSAEAKLKDKVEELRKVNEVMVGRELKMVEMKAELERLKGKT